MKKAGIKTVIYTDISRDGMLCGPNIASTVRLLESTGMEIIASGGVSSMDDLKALKKAGIPGAILGKALYEGRIELPKAICSIENPSDFAEFKTDGQGLIPVIVQDDETLEVLMLAYMNEEAYERTLQSGLMNYYSILWTSTATATPCSQESYRPELPVTPAITAVFTGVYSIRRYDRPQAHKHPAVFR